MVKQSIELEEAKTKLADLAEQAAGGEEVVLTRGGEPVAKLVAASRPDAHEHLEPRKPGSAKGMVFMSDDFDEPLDDFAAHM